MAIRGEDCGVVYEGLSEKGLAVLMGKCFENSCFRTSSSHNKIVYEEKAGSNLHDFFFIILVFCYVDIDNVL